jgi:hypothetical protein
VSIPFFSNLRRRFSPPLTRDLPTDGSAGLLGSKLETAWPKTALYTWFQLAQVGEPVQQDKHWITSYKPGGEAFRSLTTLEAETDEDGMILSLRLLLARSFIGSPTNGIFASDLAKSFLRIAVPAPDNDLVASLADEIELRAGTSRPLIVREDSPLGKPPAGRPSKPYQVFAGQSDKTWQTDNGYTLLLLQEEKVDGEQTLRIELKKA